MRKICHGRRPRYLIKRGLFPAGRLLERNIEIEYARKRLNVNKSQTEAELEKINYSQTAKTPDHQQRYREMNTRSHNLELVKFTITKL